MELNQFADEVAKRHVQRSLREMHDAKTDSWKNGERAREQAREIAEALVKKVIEQGENANAG